MVEDEFEWPEEEVEQDAQLSLTAIEKIKVLKTIQEYASKTIDSIELKLKSEEDINFSILSRYVSNVVEINNLENDPNITEDEIFFKLKEIDATVAKAEVSYEKKKPEKAALPPVQEDDNTGNDALDF